MENKEENCSLASLLHHRPTQAVRTGSISGQWSGNCYHAQFADKEYKVQTSCMPMAWSSKKGMARTCPAAGASVSLSLSLPSPPPPGLSIEQGLRHCRPPALLLHELSETPALFWQQRAARSTQFLSPRSFGENYTLRSSQISWSFSYPAVRLVGRL